MTTLSENVEAVWRGSDGTVWPLPVWLAWYPSDPWAIEVTFQPGGCPEHDVVWLVGRELLFAGLTGPLGDGDVRVRPVEAGQWVALELSTPDGHAVIELHEQAVREFLTATYHAIPAGQELLWAPMDDELTELMNGSDR